ncbi:MAG: reverse transcriptase domain-containing protein, partial [Candidatus Thiodiazotropha sp.]
MSASPRAPIIASLNKSSTICNIEIEGIETKAFVDTGAEISLVSEKFRQSSNILKKLKVKSVNGLKATSVNNEPVQLLGCVTLNMRLGDVDTAWTFYVTREMSHPVLLGWDFIQGNDVTINGSKSEMTIGASTIQFLPLWRILPRVCSASLKESVVIPPRTEVMVAAKLEPVKNYEIVPDGYDGVLEAKDIFQNEEGVLVARTAGTVVQGTTPVKLMNVGESEVKLQANTSVGSFYAAVPTGAKVARVGIYEFVDCDLEGNHPQTRNSVKGEKTNMPHVSLDKPNLNGEQKRAAETLLTEFQDIFSDSKNDLGRTNLTQHSIFTNDARPIKQPPRRVPFAMREQLQKQVDEMLEQDIIEPSKSPWSSPVVLVKKKDGSFRFCVDYRRLNAVTCKDAHPLPRVDDCLDALSGSKVFSTLDCASGYWQVEMNLEDREKTAFSTGENLFQFKVMPFGLTNAPATFQRLMDLVLAGMHWKCCLVYLDDIIVFTSTVDEHLTKLREVFSCIRDAGLTLKSSKCQLFETSVSFLGHQVSGSGIRPDANNIEKVLNFAVPRNVTELQSFLGLANYYRKFIRNFANIAEPLNRLLHKDTKFMWTDDSHRAFEKLRQSLTTYPVLAYPDFQKPFRVQTDASGWAVGAVLSQEQKGEEKVIAYASSTLSKSERNWSAYDKEFYAVVWAIRHFRPYLGGSRFVVMTDHKPLANLRSIKQGHDPTGRRERWSIELSAYDFSIQYRKGINNGNADALSRLPENGSEQEGQRGLDSTGTVSAADSSSHIPVVTGSQQEHQQNLGSRPLASAVSAADSSSHSRGQSRDRNASSREAWLEKLDIKDHQEKDSQIRPILTMIRKGSREPLDGAVGPALRSLWGQWPRLVLEDGILHRRWESGDGKESHLQLVVPKTLTKKVLSSLHSLNTAAHLGYEKTLAKVKARFYWFGYQKDTEQFCKQCEMCAASKAPPYTVRAPLQQDVPAFPWERIAMDVVGPLPVTEAGNKYILVISDYFTKWPEAFALKDHKAETIARVLVDEVICRHGVPRSIHTDQGRDFESNLLKHVCELLEIEKTRTTAYHPESDGLVERLNKTLVTMLRSCVDEDQKNWDTLLPKILLGYRTSVQSTTGYSPFRLVYGREAMLPVDIMFGGSKERFSTQNQFVVQQEELLETGFEKVRSHVKAEQKRQKYYYDRKGHSSGQKAKYEVGDWVRVYNPSTKKGLVKKLRRCYTGPYRVIKVITDVVYRVQKVQGRQRIVVHYNRLKDASEEKLAIGTPVNEVPYSTPPTELVQEHTASTDAGERKETSNDPVEPTGVLDTFRGLTISNKTGSSPDSVN